MRLSLRVRLEVPNFNQPDGRIHIRLFIFMPFTVKTLFKRVDLDSEAIRSHQFQVGKSIKNSWWNRNSTNVERVSEDGFMVCSYPDDFIRIASVISKRYITKHNLPLKKRARKEAKND